MALSTRLRELIDILSFRRGHALGEQKMVDKYVSTLPGAYEDLYGNIHVQVDDSPILWSSHVDSVDRTEGKAGTRQTLDYRASTGKLRLSKASRRIRGSVLGADDGVGVWIMRQMILAGCPGYYLFHFGEESGCIGSGDLARQCGAWLSKMFQFAIALDRRDYSDIITHQCGYRTCSDPFALSLALQLNRDPRLKYRPSDRGLYTDTREYAPYVPECTNLSVGYNGEHSATETLDVGHAMALLDSLLALDWTQLVAERVAEDERHGWESSGITTDSPRDYSSYDRYPRGRLYSFDSRRYEGFGDSADPDTDIMIQTVNRDATRAANATMTTDPDYDLIVDLEDEDNEDGLYLNPEYAAVMRALKGA